MGLLAHLVVLFLDFSRNMFSIVNCINLHSHQLCKKVPFSPVFTVCRLFLMMAILKSVRRYLIVVKQILTE